MNHVAVTEGDKVEAQIKFGWEVDHYNINDAVEYVNAVNNADVKALMEEYDSRQKGCKRNIVSGRLYLQFCAR